MNAVATESLTPLDLSEADGFTPPTARYRRNGIVQYGEIFGVGAVVGKEC